MYTWHVIKEMLSRHVESRQGFDTKVSLICIYMYDIIVAGWDGGKRKIQ